jgi:leucyl-tRNA synthetase
MHSDLIEKFLNNLAISLSPIAPHFCEHLYQRVLGNSGNIVSLGRWPTLNPVDLGLARKFQVLQDSLRSFRLDMQRYLGAKKGKVVDHPNEAVIFVAKEYLPYQCDVLSLIGELVPLDSATNEPIDKKWISLLKAKLPAGGAGANSLKFASFHMSTEVKARGIQALETSLPFDEAAMLAEQTSLIKRQLGVESLRIVSKDIDLAEDVTKPTKRELSIPGKATILFLNSRLSIA